MLWGCIKASWCAVARVDCASKMAANWWRHQNACEIMWGFMQVHLKLSLFCSIYYNIRLIDNITLYIWLIDLILLILPMKIGEIPNLSLLRHFDAQVPFSKIGLPLQPLFRTVRHILRGEKEVVARGNRGNGDRWDEIWGFHQQRSGDLVVGGLIIDNKG